MKPGDLVYKKKDKRHFFQVLRGEYTARLMEAQDYEMEMHGMGDYAGVFTSVIDVVDLSSRDAGKVFKKQRMSWFSKVRDEG